MKYPGLFKAKYGPLAGSDWLTRISPEDRKVFSSLGAAASDYGRAGAAALLKRRSKINDQGKNEYMSTIGARGALSWNVKRDIIRKAREECNL